MKKAAMFGLDARVALAIFGSLSVVTGASLYSAIQESKITAIITQLNELGKSYEEFYFDTRVELEPVSTNFLKISDLHSGTQRGWNGPYTNLTGSATSLNWNGYYLNLHAARDGAWSAATPAAWADAKCSSNTVSGECYVWAAVSLGTTSAHLDIANKIDERIDGTQNAVEGDVRIFRGSPSLSYYALVKQRIYND
tara:strand:- start:1040 stop:1627 length:588 start_codon:yes stop_codon:yes gene_type:complete